MPSHAVRFAPTTQQQVCLVPSRSDVLPSVLASCHYSYAEFEAMQRDAVRTVRALRRQQWQIPPNNEENEATATARGLEHLRSPAVLRARTRNKYDVLNAVFDEQERQWAAGRTYFDDEALAVASRRTSAAAVQLALTMGASDAAFVRAQLRAERAQRILRAEEVVRATLELCHHQTQQSQRPGRRHTVSLGCLTLPDIGPPTARDVFARSASLPGKIQ